MANTSQPNNSHLARAHARERERERETERERERERECVCVCVCVLNMKILSQKYTFGPYILGKFSFLSLN